MNEVPAWVGLAVAGAIAIAILLERVGLVACERLEQRLSRKQKIAGAAALLAVAAALAAHGLLRIYGR